MSSVRRSLKVGSMPSYRGEIMSWAEGLIEHDGKIRARNLGAAVCADGANGLTVISSTEARKRGLYVQPGDFEVPLVACPEAPRPPAKPRSKSGQRRAHARWGR